MPVGISDRLLHARCRRRIFHRGCFHAATWDARKEKSSTSCACAGRRTWNSVRAVRLRWSGTSRERDSAAHLAAANRR